MSIDSFSQAQHGWMASRRSFLLVFFSLALLFWAAKYHPFLKLPRIIDDDARQHVYWVYKFQDQTLFKDDLLTDFISSPRFDPLGYQGLYFLASYLIDPLLFSQILSLLLLLASIWLFHSLLEDISSRAGIGFGTVLFIFYFLYAASGGFPRSFAFPLLLGFLYFYARSSAMGVSALLVLEALFYPPILLNCLALTAINWTRRIRRLEQTALYRELITLAAGMVVAGGILSYVYVFYPGESYGKMLTREEAAAMPEFSPEGRTAFFGYSLIGTLMNERGGIAISRLSGFLIIIAAMLIFAGRSRFRVPAVVKELLASSFMLFVAAHIVLFRLHLPSRYVLYSLPLACMITISANLEAAKAGFYEKLPALRPLLGAIINRKVIPRCISVALVIMSVYVQYRYVPKVDPLEIEVDRVSMGLYRFLESLPKEAVVAGHPLEMDNVPLFSRRIVLVNQELSLPYYKDYYKEIRRRLFDTFSAYYASDAEDVYRFVRRYGVSYMVVKKDHFSPAFLKGRIYYEPFNGYIKERLSADGPFALLEDPSMSVVFENERYLVLFFRKGQRKPPGPGADPGRPA